MATSVILRRLNESFGSFYEELKEKQAECIIHSLNNDVLGILPTGYGKTLIIQALPFLSDDHSTVVVINGLRSILQEQAAKFGGKCIVVDDDFVSGLGSSDPKKVFFP